MLLLYETAAGFALFKVLDEGKLIEAQDLYKDFETVEKAQNVVKLKAFSRFDNNTEALAAATATVDSKLSKGLKKFLKKNAEADTLAVLDSKLGNIVKEKLGIQCVYSNAVMELSRGIRNQITGLISGLAAEEMMPMSLGLSHSLSRYKLKFSPDKVDTMIVQAIGLLDDLDKELNTYGMRVREWFGWHFPEMTKVITDNIKYAKTVKLMGSREHAAGLDFSEVLEEEEESALKDAAIVSMGTEVSEDDMLNIMALCDQVIALAEYRGQLYDYLRSRMQAIAPNLTVLVGELVGARLIAHAGSLINLAKAPASTVQILGAEKALFRALKTKHDTPKYGLIYHASLIGQSHPKFKGKISRVLAAKCSLSIRVDALGESTDASIGLEARAKVEARLRQLEGKMLATEGAQPRGKPQPGKYDPARQSGNAAMLVAPKAYNADADVPGDVSKPEKKRKKREPETETNGPVVNGELAAAEIGAVLLKKKKKAKKESVEADEADPAGAGDGEQKPKKKAKQAERYFEGAGDGAAAAGAGDKVEKVKKKKKAKLEQ